MASASFMSKHSRILVAAVTLLALPAAAHAQRTLTLDEALSIAHRNNRDLRAAQARVAQAHAGVLTALAALLPVVTTQGKYTHNYKEVVLPASEFTGATTGLADTLKTAAMVARTAGARRRAQRLRAGPHRQHACQHRHPEGRAARLRAQRRRAADRALRLSGAAGGASQRGRRARQLLRHRRAGALLHRAGLLRLRRRRRTGRGAPPRGHGHAKGARQRARAPRGRRGQSRRGDPRRAAAGARAAGAASSPRTRRRRPIARSGPS